MAASFVAVANAADTARERPEIGAQRWKENWSVLTDPAVPRRPLDSLKYIPLSAGDPHAYLSLGVTLRERLESNDARAFGTGGARRDGGLLQRLQIHADLHLDQRWRAFVQFEDVRAFGLRQTGPADENPLDLRLAFVDHEDALGRGRVTLRAGRQDLDVGEERFISGREGPNVRQSFDALWAAWGDGDTRYAGFVARPVRYRDVAAFDDRTSRDVQFASLRAERGVAEYGTVAAYYLFFENDEAAFPNAAGRERRHAADLRWSGEGGGWDWNVETMLQAGTVGPADALAWAAGGRAGYRTGNAAFAPRLGLQADAASGDRRAGDGRLGTFNPLFPSGALFTQADYTGYANLLHLKPSLTFGPGGGLSVTTAIGLQWRQTVADAIYRQPSVPIGGTAGQGGRWSGAYGQIRADYAFTPTLRGAVELVHYRAGNTIRSAGGADSTYLGLQLSAGW